MKSHYPIVALLFCLVLLPGVASGAGPRTGFFLPDSVNEVTLKYRTIKGLVVLPVTINDSVHVNLILDTGCRNLVLFGKKYADLLKINSDRPVEFSGLGEGRPVIGLLSIGNKVSIHSVLGEQIPVVIVKTNSLFGSYRDIHGVIGYDIFVKFEVELNARQRTITFRPAAKAQLPVGYEQIPLQIVDSRPVMKSHVFLGKSVARAFDLMIDTGSSLGLLLKTTDISALISYRSETILGTGLNGPLSGYEIITNKIVLRGLEMERVPTGVVSSRWHNNASIGMQVLKDYILVLNYCKLYACLKPNPA